MEFFVKLIEVIGSENEAARKSLQSNCTHVAKDYWLYEGDEDALDPGLNFIICGEVAIEGYGELSGCQLRRMVVEQYKIDPCFIF